MRRHKLLPRELRNDRHMLNRAKKHLRSNNTGSKNHSPISKTLQQLKVGRITRNRYLREALTDIALVSIIAVIFSPLFEHGPLFVGDYVATSQINPISQFLKLFYPVDLYSRNAGYSFRPYFLQWALGPFLLVSAALGFMFGSLDYSKLVIVAYLAGGALGMNHLLNRILSSRSSGSTPWRVAVKSACSLFYVLNPAVIQLLVKGYVGIIATLAFLPIIILCYDNLSKSRSGKDMLAKGLIVSILIYSATNYTYPLLILGAALVTYELSHSLRPPIAAATRRISIRLSLVVILTILLELPTIYVFTHESASGFLSSFYSGQNLSAFYYGASSYTSPLGAVTLTSASWSPSYFQTFFPAYYALYMIGILGVLIIDIFGLALYRWSAWTLHSSILLLLSILLALGANFLPNLWFFETFPIFLEAFQFLPLVAFSLGLLTAVTFFPTTLPRINRTLKLNLRLPRRMILLLLLLAVLVLSIVPLRLMATTNLSPSSIPTYDQQAYNWLAGQPGDGRIFLVPPSYGIRYPFDAQKYATPVDYWSVSPPKPIVLDNGGSLGGLEQLMPYALYSGNTKLLDYMLSALGVQYVVFRNDVVDTWGVPYYTNITSSYVSNNFTFLQLNAEFGPISIFENTHFSGLFDAYAYPILVSGDVSSLPVIAQVLQPGVPVLFTSDLTSSQIRSILESYPSPVVMACNVVCPHEPDQYTNHTSVAVVPLEDSFGVSRLVNTDWKFAEAVTGSGSVVATSGTVFGDDFRNSTFTDNSWITSEGSWATFNGSYLTNSDIYQPYSLVTVPAGLDNFVIETNVTVRSGFSAGIVLNQNSSTIMGDSYQVQLIPSWNAVVLSRYNQAIGSSIESAQTPLAYNTTYEVALTYVGSRLEVILDGKPMISVALSNIPRGMAGVFTTQAHASFSDYRIMKFENNPVSPIVIQGDSSQGSYLLKLTKDQELFIGVVNGTQGGIFLLNSQVNALEILDPARSSITYRNTGPYSWSLQKTDPSLQFLVARFDDFQGVVSFQGEVYKPYGYAIGFGMGTSALLGYDSTYELIAVISFSITIIAFGVTVYWASKQGVNAIRTIRRPKGELDSDPSKDHYLDSSLK